MGNEGRMRLDRRLAETPGNRCSQCSPRDYSVSSPKSLHVAARTAHKVKACSTPRPDETGLTFCVHGNIYPLLGNSQIKGTIKAMGYSDPLLAKVLPNNA